MNTTSETRPVAASYYSAPAFLNAWVKGIGLAGARWFGDGSQEQLNHFTSKNDLRPRYADIREALGWLSSGEAAFLVAMYSFFNARAAGEMFEQIGVRGLAHLSQRLDEPHLRVIGDLLVSYEGW